MSGDDARYTLAGSKVIVLMLSVVMQKVERPLDARNPIFRRSQSIQRLDLSRFVFFVLRYELSLGVETLDPVMRVIAWSWNAPRPPRLWLEERSVLRLLSMGSTRPLDLSVRLCPRVCAGCVVARLCPTALRSLSAGETGSGIASCGT